MSESVLFPGQGGETPPAPPGPLPRLVVSPSELATILGLSTRELQRLRNRGLVPEPDLAVSPRIQRWYLESIRSWLRAGCPPVEIWNSQLQQIRRGQAS